MVTKLKHYNPSASDFEADWHVLDAKGKVLGRIASEAATLLMGKHRPTYVPHMLSGDFVVVINAADVTVTGNKAEQIVYKRHSQRPGKLKEIPYQRVKERFPARVIEHAVRGMLPKNKLGERMIRRLKVYAGEEHPHVSQLAWTAGRPERDAAAAAEAEEAARKRAEQRQRAAARKEIAADAAAKTAASDAEAEEKPKRGRRSSASKKESAETKAATAVAEPETAEATETADEAPEEAVEKKKPATRRRSTAKKASTAKSSASKSSTRSRSSASKSSSSKSSTARKKSEETKEDE